MRELNIRDIDALIMGPEHLLDRLNLPIEVDESLSIHKELFVLVLLDPLEWFLDAFHDLFLYVLGIVVGLPVLS